MFEMDSAADMSVARWPLQGMDTDEAVVVIPDASVRCKIA